MDADGSNARAITAAPRNDRNAVWSPDGAQIAFIGLPRDTSHYIYIMEAACIAAADCAPAPAYPGFRFQGMPQWSPDGRYLAFVGQTRLDDSDAIYVLDTQRDTEPYRLVSDVFYAYAERWPMWSPDSQYIAYARRTSPGLFIVEVATGIEHQLSALRSVYPVWQP
jgi:Tol biopolymer transport system component